jgi:hydrogenase maturation factor HypE
MKISIEKKFSNVLKFLLYYGFHSTKIVLRNIMVDGKAFLKY